MILYHGTNQDFDVIDLEKSNPYKDFGRGFYLTNLRHQAELLASKKARLFGCLPDRCMVHHISSRVNSRDSIL